MQNACCCWAACMHYGTSGTEHADFGLAHCMLCVLLAIMQYASPHAHGHASRWPPLRTHIPLACSLFPPCRCLGVPLRVLTRPSSHPRRPGTTPRRHHRRLLTRSDMGRCLALCSAAAIAQFARVGQVHSVCTVAPRPWNTNMPLITISTPAPPW